MKLKKIEIKKFRTIDFLEIEVESLFALIGENNAGKSNILRAIELFYEDSVRGINEEYFYFKNQSSPISIILTYSDLTEEEKNQKYVKDFIYDENIRIRKSISYESESKKYSMTLYGWQAVPNERHFDISRFDEYKQNLTEIVESNSLPNYFRNEGGTVTQASYKEGVKRYILEETVELGEPEWLINPGGLKEVFTSLFPKFYLVPAVQDAQDESKTTQQTVLGKLITDLTNRIVSKNPQFENVKNQIDGLKKYLNRAENGTDDNRLIEIKELEMNLSTIISESMPGSKVEIKIITPELLDLFKETKIILDDSLPTSIDSKGHGLQRALIFAYIRAYAKTINYVENDYGTSVKNFILGVEEPELFLHPNGQRKMMGVLSNIAKTDQVILCTHSNFFVNMFNYKEIVIVKRENNGPTTSFQFKGDIFEAEEGESLNRLRKVFRYLSFFDLSRNEMFFSKKVILVEGDTEKFIIPFWASKHISVNKKYDFSSENICVIDCGGKYNLHVFMRVLNKFKIPYIVIHDVDPIDFPEDKQDKTDGEKARLRCFKENDFIKRKLDISLGKIIKINPKLETIIGVSQNQVYKEGKIGAAYLKFEGLNIEDYPTNIKIILDLVSEWNENNEIIELS